MAYFNASSAAAGLGRKSGSGILGVLVGAMALHRQRQAVARLDDHLLADVGLTREDAETEAGRPVWDAPNHWMR